MLSDGFGANTVREAETDGASAPNECLPVQAVEARGWESGRQVLNPNQGVTQALQEPDTTTTEPNEKPSKGSLQKQSVALPVRRNDTSERQFGAHLVRETPEADSDLAEVVKAWPQLPEATRSAIVAIVRAAVDDAGE